MAAATHRYFLVRRLHSLSGVVPVGGYLAFHLFANFTATRGPEAYDHLIETIEKTPFLLPLEIGVIFVPILFHAVYGVFIAREADNNLGRSPYVRNWLFVLQRWTGLVAFAFIAVHVWQLRFVRPLNFSVVASLLQDTLWFAAYVIGVFSCVFHLCNGLWSFCVRWGITVGPRSQRVSSYVWAAVGLLLFYVGMSSLRAFVS
jgi:succinate dehydrogenase / fumarate reductase cytochrome b subunit